MITSGAYDVVVLDSLAALSPAKEIDGDVADEHVGLAARRNNRMFRKIQMRMNEVAKVNPILTPTFFSINQERINIKVTFGDPRIKPGGNGQDFFSSVEVLFWGNQVTYFDSDKKSPKSSSFGFKVVKNKISPPMIQGEYEQALVDDPAGNFFAGDVIEIGTVMEFAKKFKVFEEVEQSKTKKVWKMYGQTFERKKDVLQQWCHDKEKFSLLKEDLIARIFKRVHIDAEKRENERSNAGIEG
jgi:recombination protein RecA